MTNVKSFAIAVAALSAFGAHPLYAKSAKVSPLEAGRVYEPGEIVEIAPKTLMIAETPLDFVQHHADAGAIVLHRAGDTLYLIDTGAMAHYRPIIKAAAAALGRVDKIVLINTHNHIDHTGNNDIIAEIPAKQRWHYLSGIAAKYMVDQSGYWEEGAGKLVAVRDQIPDWTPAGGDRAYWDEELKIFDPKRVSAGTAVALENLPMAALDIDGVHEFGWRFGDDDMYVIPTRGHTAGSVVVYFPKVKVLDLGDESNGHFPSFLSASPQNALVGFGRYLNLLDAGALDIVVAGHKREVYVGEESIRNFLNTFFEREAREESYFLDPLREAGENGLTLAELAAALRAGPWWSEFYARADKIFPWAPGLILLKRLEVMQIPYRDDAEGARHYYLPPQALDTPVGDE